MTVTLPEEFYPTAYVKGRVLSTQLEEVPLGNEVVGKPVTGKGLVRFIPAYASRVSESTEPLTLILEKAVIADLDSGGYLSTNNNQNVKLYTGIWKVEAAIPGAFNFIPFLINVSLSNTEQHPLEVWRFMAGATTGGADLVLPPDPVEGAILGWENGVLSWITRQPKQDQIQVFKRGDDISEVSAGSLFAYIREEGEETPDPILGSVPRIKAAFYGTTTSDNDIPVASFESYPGDIVVLVIASPSDKAIEITDWYDILHGGIRSGSLLLSGFVHGGGVDSLNFIPEEYFGGAWAVYVIGGDENDNKTVVQGGAPKRRPDEPIELNTITAPGLKVPRDSRVLNIAAERTLAKENTSDISFSSGTPLNVYKAEDPMIEILAISQQQASKGSVSKTEVITFPNVQANNGIGIQLGFSFSEE